MKRFGFLFALAAIEMALLSGAQATDPQDPDWPCVQPKVPEMSAATMWDGPSIADVGTTWQDDPKVKELVERIAARRTPVDAATKAVAEFITGTPAEKQDKAKLVFAGMFSTLSQERGDVLDGLDRVSRNEKSLGDKIRSDVTELRSLEDNPTADQAKVQTLANEVEWSTRIFEDRRKTIRYVCEVPTTIEQRVFTLARAIQQTLN